MRRSGPSPWAWLAVLVALGRTTAYTDTDEFLSDLDKPGMKYIIMKQILLNSIENNYELLSPYLITHQLIS